MSFGVYRFGSAPFGSTKKSAATIVTRYKPYAMIAWIGSGF